MRAHIYGLLSFRTLLQLHKINVNDSPLLEQQNLRADLKANCTRYPGYFNFKSLRVAETEREKERENVCVPIDHANLVNTFTTRIISPSRAPIPQRSAAKHNKMCSIVCTALYRLC